MSSLKPPLYRGSVKDLLGPVSVNGESAMIFEYTDAYSVFDWGRMPDPIQNKGAALATLAAHWFEGLENAQSWKDFSKSPVAHGLRKANRFGSTFIELGEKLQHEGLRTHYLGVIEKLPDEAGSVSPVRLADARGPVKHLVVRQVSVAKPRFETVLGRQVPDYGPTRATPAPRLVPLEVVFRFGVPKGSSLLERVERDPNYMASIGFGGFEACEGAEWDFPVLEVFTKLEPSDRPLTLSEALAISGLSGAQLNEVLMKTAWAAAWVKAQCARSGLELADGKLEWGVDRDGSIFLVDAIGPDELRILSDGVQLSKEFLRAHYRETSWHEALARAKSAAKKAGSADWKRLVTEPPPVLSPAIREVTHQLYPALTNELSGKPWFTGAWKLQQVVEGIRKTPQS